MNKSAVCYGTLGGIMMGVYPNLMAGDAIKTIILSIIGAVVSFLVSLIIGLIFRRK